jgi:hypothetical protein
MAEETTYSIELIIEDGTAIPSANSYVSMEYADTYCKNRGYTDWLALDEYTRKSAILKAMDYIDNLFPWKGRKIYKVQSLSFPRRDIVDLDGFDRTGEIPEQLKKAVCEAAFYAYNQTTLYEKSNTSIGAVKVDKSRKKADVVEIETEKQYQFPENFKIDWTSAYQSLDKLLKGLYEDKTATNHVCIPAVWR